MFSNSVSFSGHYYEKGAKNLVPVPAKNMFKSLLSIETHHQGNLNDFIQKVF